MLNQLPHAYSLVVLSLIENIEQKKRSEETRLNDKVEDFADKENQRGPRVGNKTKVSMEEQISALVELNIGHVPKQIRQKLKKLKRGFEEAEGPQQSQRVLPLTVIGLV